MCRRKDCSPLALREGAACVGASRAGRCPDYRLVYGLTAPDVGSFVKFLEQKASAAHSQSTWGAVGHLALPHAAVRAARCPPRARARLPQSKAEQRCEGSSALPTLGTALRPRRPARSPAQVAALGHSTVSSATWGAVPPAHQQPLLPLGCALSMLPLGCARRAASGPGAARSASPSDSAIRQRAARS